MTVTPNTITHDVFISYAEADRAWVDGFLLDALDEAGARVHSEDAFALGVPRLIEFERAIQQSQRTLLILSPAYLADTFGQFVDVLVNSYGMETATWPVIPLILQSVALPPRLSQLKALTATTREAQQAALVRLCAELKRPVPGLAPLPACPYPGMVPFDESDSDRFFGREQEVQELAERLRLHPFLAVIGASGSGKSSLVRAGLIPALRKNRSFGGGSWLIRTLRPGETPLDTLAQTLGTAIKAPAVPPSAAPAGADLLSMLLIKADLPASAAGSAATNGQSVDPPSASSATTFDAPQAAAALLAATPDSQRLLVLVDQFEETFTVAHAQAALFQQALLQLAAAPGCYVVLTVRADFYADLMGSPLWEQIQAHRAEVTPLREADLRRAIVRPAEQAGVAVEAALVERLAADAAGEPGVLPLVQETLVLLWERLERRFLPMRAYEALVLRRSAYGAQDGGEPNGLQVAIARRADATLASLTEAQQPIARRIFLRLIQFGEGRADTRRQQPVTALRSAGDDPRLFDQTLQRLAESRLLTLSGAEMRDNRRQTIDDGLSLRTQPSSTVHHPSSIRVDIAHEALIRGWPALQGWLSERREGEQTRRRLADKAAEWVRLGRSNGGLLDEVELLEAERWLQSPDADAIGFDQALPDLAVRSRAAIEQAAQEKEQARQHELAQAQALAEEQSRRAEEQAAASQRLRRRAVFLGVALVAAVVAVVAVVLISFQAKQRERQAHAGELAAQAEATIDESPQRSLLLAVEALKTTGRVGERRAIAAEQALRDTLAIVDGRVLDGGQTSDVSVVVQSADGRQFASGSNDGTVRVWNISTASLGLPVILRSRKALVFSLIYSPDGHWLAASGFDGMIHVWNMLSANPDASVMLFHGSDPQFSSDGRWLATGGTDKTVQVWDLVSSEPAAHAMNLANSRSAPMFSPDGHWLATAGTDGVPLLWALGVSGPSHAARRLPSTGELSFFSPDGNWLVTRRKDRTAQLWRVASDGPAVPTHGLPNGTIVVVFSNDGRWISTSNRGGLQLYRLTAAGPAPLEDSLPDATSPAIFSPDGRWLASAGAVGTMRLWNLSSTDPISNSRILRDAGDSITNIVWSQNEQYLAIYGLGQTARVWDLTTKNSDPPASILRGHEGAIRFAAFTLDGQALITRGLEQTVRLWDLAPAKQTVLDGNSVLSALSSDGHWFASISDDDTMRVWNLTTQDADPISWPRSNSDICTLVFSQGGRWLATGSTDGSVRLWDMTVAHPSAEPIIIPTAFDPSGDSQAKGAPVLAVSLDGKYLATKGVSGPVRVWDLGIRPARQLHELHTDAVSVALSPDGRILITGIPQLGKQFWDLKASTADIKPSKLRDADGIVLFSSDGRLLITGSNDRYSSLRPDKALRVWDVSAIYSGKGSITLKRVLYGHEKYIAAAALNGAEQPALLATVSGTNRIRIWDLSADPHEQPIIFPNQAEVQDLAFSSERHTLNVVSNANILQQWPLDYAGLIPTACRITGRNLTWDEWQRAFGSAAYERTCVDVPPHPSYIIHLLDDASAQAQQGQILAAKAAYNAAKRSSPDFNIGAGYWNSLCRNGVLWGYVNDVLDACGNAVAQAPTEARYRDSRGLTRALIGDAAGAIEDFQAYIDWATSVDAEANKAAIAQREFWIVALKAGGQPITDDVLKQLRAAEQ